MALFNEADIRRAARELELRTFGGAERILREARQTSATSFDVFLSHAKLDAQLVLGVKTVLERSGQSVYIDWLDDPQLDRSSVTPATAERLRNRMRQCESLIYVYTRNAANSRWMPWELGYFDAFNGNVAVLPIVQSSAAAPYKGEEFVGLYPYVDVRSDLLYIHRSAADYARFGEWRRRADKLRPAT